MKTAKKTISVCFSILFLFIMSGVAKAVADGNQDTAYAVDSYDQEYNINDGAVNITTPGNYLITGVSKTQNTISIGADGVKVTISGVNIAAPRKQSAIAITGTGTVTIFLADGSLNELNNGIYVDPNAALIIDGTGNLTTGAIGGNPDNVGKADCGAITILNGTIDCTNGIGGGSAGRNGSGFGAKGGSCKDIKILGGIVSAGYIGGGDGEIVSGSSVTATGGAGGSCSNVTINNATVSTIRISGGNGGEATTVPGASGYGPNTGGNGGNIGDITIENSDLVLGCEKEKIGVSSPGFGGGKSGSSGVIAGINGKSGTCGNVSITGQDKAILTLTTIIDDLGSGYLHNTDTTTDYYFISRNNQKFSNVWTVCIPAGNYECYLDYNGWLEELTDIKGNTSWRFSAGETTVEKLGRSQVVEVYYYVDGELVDYANDVHYGGTHAPNWDVSSHAAEGYKFGGTWYANAALTEPYDFSQYLEDELYLYGEWTLRDDIPYTISHMLQNVNDDGYTQDGSNSGYGTMGEEIPIDSYVQERNGFIMAKCDTGTISAAGDTALAIYYDRNTYTVSFEPNNGTTMGDQRLRYEGLVNTNAPKRKNYNFTGWYTNAELTNEFSTDTPVTEDLTLYAGWSLKDDTPYHVEHFIQDVAGDGYTKVDTENRAGVSGAAVTATPKVYKGFHENTAHASRVPSGSIEENGSLTLALYYDRDTFTVSYDSAGGSSVEAQSGIRYEGKASAPTPPARAGYDFAGWYAGDAAYDFTKPVTADVALAAHWTARTDTVYRVEHYIQDTSGAGYTLRDSDEMQGTTGAAVTATAKEYDGFIEDTAHENHVATGTIAGDGSLVLKLYYASKPAPSGGSIPAPRTKAVGGYITGFDDGTFRPDSKITRCELVTILARVSADYDPAMIYPVKFSDVPAGAWYSNYLGFCVNKGYITGDEAGMFRPMENTDKGGFSAMLARFMGYANKGTASFSDVTEDYWATGYIAQLAEHGMITGDSKGAYNPVTLITRGEVVQMVNAALGRKPDKATLDKLYFQAPVFSDIKDHDVYYEAIEAAYDHKHIIST